MTGQLILLIFTLFGYLKCDGDSYGILYPKETETRQKISLDGLWNFAIANHSYPLQGYTDHWYKRSLTRIKDVNVQLMPVPSSYNDITMDWELRDHVGLVWYDRTFVVPSSWSNQRVWIRFGSVSYAAQVWINGEIVIAHEIGHLPFEVEITEYVKFGKQNLVTVSCDNTLLATTLPQGSVEELSSGRLKQSYTFDFFNYAGIDRSVILYSTPKSYIEDITVSSDIENNKGILNYEVVFTLVSNVTCSVSLMDKEGNVVANSGDNDQPNGRFVIQNPKLWWPYLMDPDPGYLYDLEVKLLDLNGQLVDKYNLPVGIRKLNWSNTTFTINNKPIYLYGFGRHEDSDIRGKGLDLPLIIRDHNLIKWIGANAYRTSHYPYAEEIMDLADQMGIMIIDECPAVNVDGFSDALLTKHKNSLTELINRDKNRPSVIMWSAANEPRTQYPAAKEYFRQVIEHIKSLDTTRPTTIVEAQSSTVVESSRFVDIISFNRYNGWYTHAGDLDVVAENVITEATAWHNKFNKPVIHQEYGADTLEGLHIDPAYIWTEEYQVQLMTQHFQAFDILRAQGFFVGEFIWNFADFKTAQTYTRVGGNKKGIFTRNRQPKSSAHLLRRRYWNLSKYIYNATLPSDLENYIAPNAMCSHDEL